MSILKDQIMPDIFQVISPKKLIIGIQLLALSFLTRSLIVEYFGFNSIGYLLLIITLVFSNPFISNTNLKKKDITKLGTKSF